MFYNQKTCIICNSSLGLGSLTEKIEAPDLIEHEEFILRTFVSNFGIQLPLTPVNLKNVTLDWNLQEESLPFCTSCERIAENLVELCQQLETIKHEIELTKTRIRSEIIKSNKIVHDREAKGAIAVTVTVPTDENINQESEGIDISGKISDAKLTKKLAKKKVIKIQDGFRNKAKVLRDLIVGPILRISRCDCTVGQKQEKEKEIPAPSALHSAQREVKIDGNQIQIQHQQPADCGKNQLKSHDLDGELIIKVDPFADRDYFSWNDDGTNDDDSNYQDEDTLNPLESENNNDFIKSSPQSTEIVSPKNKNDDDEDDEPTNEEADADDCNFDSENEVTVESDDPDDEDFHVTASDEERLELTSKRNRSHGRKLKAKVKKHRGSDYNPPKVRQTVKCADAADKYIYDGRFEFQGNDRDGFKCSLCPTRKFARKRIAIRHIRDLHLKDEIQNEAATILCTICGKFFRTPAGLERHSEAHREKRKVCLVCGEKFRTDLALKFHMERDHSERPIICEFCGKAFDKRVNANCHIRLVHRLKEKGHVCEQCGRGFKTPASLKVHMSTHSTDQPYECSLCGQKFKKHGTRSRHLKTFHGHVAPTKTVATSSLLSRKSNSEVIGSEPNSEQESPIPLTAPTESEMETEEDMEGEDPDPAKSSLKCKLCGLQYNRQNNLTRHLLQIHHINVKGLAWKSRKSQPFPNISQPTFPVPVFGLSQSGEHTAPSLLFPSFNPLSDQKL